MLKLLEKPYFFETSKQKYWRRSFFIALFVFLFLFVFRPFGLSQYPGNLLLLTLGFGGVSFLLLAFFFFLVYPIFPTFFNEEKWTLGREILSTAIVLSLIGLGNALFISFVTQTGINLKSILWLQLYTVLIGIFPAMSILIIKENRLSKKYSEESENLNKIIETHPKENAPTPSLNNSSERITLVSENQKENLSLNSSDLYFVKAADNYAEVFYKTGKGLERKVIRTTLKIISQSLPNNSTCYRCHKSYLVNLSKVIHVSGNAQGYKLHLSDCDYLIPVSRKLNAELKQLLSTL